jgi:autotransporter adhesin
VAAGENAKSQGKSSKSKLAMAVASASLAVGSLISTLAPIDAAADESIETIGYQVVATDSTDGDTVSTNDIDSLPADGDSSLKTDVTVPKKLFGSQMLGATPTGASVLYDDSTSNTITFGGTAGNKLTNVAAGTISAGSTDAVNGSQLFNLTNGSTVVNSAYVQINGKNDGSDKATLNSGYGNAANSIAIGPGAKTSTLGNSTGIVVIGANAHADQLSTSSPFVGGTVLGANSAILDNGIAVGYSARANVADAVALGNNILVYGSGAVALGSNTTASAGGSVALGYGSLANRGNTVSIGKVGSERQIVNVQAGTQGTDAVNYAQLQAAGLKADSNGNATNAFVAYDDTTASKVTLGGTAGTALTNLTSGDVSSATSTDAVNGSQLYATNQNVSKNTTDVATNKANIATNTADITANTTNITQNTTNIGTLNAAMADTVKYDASAHSAITLSGASGTTITNLKAGQLTATSTDAVNGSQIYAMQQTISAQGGTAADAVQYDSSAHDKITFGSVNAPAALTNVKAGDVSATSLDAVNGTQLYTVSQDVAHNTSDIATLNSTMSELNSGASGIVRQDSITQAISIGANSNGGTVSFAGLAGARTLTGVASGAVNASSTEALNGAQLFNASSSVASALGGGASVDAKGGVVAPTYTVGGKQVNDVGSAVSNLDGRVTQNTADIAGIKGDLATVASAASNAVAYDSADHSKVTLGGTDAGAAAVQLTNVAAGDLSATSTDAVNGAQLGATNDRVSAAEKAIATLDSSGVAGSTASGQDAAAIGGNADASGDHSMAAGTNATASGSSSTATGANSTATGDNSTASGSNATASGSDSTASGASSMASGNNATANGAHANASGENAAAFGGNASASGSNSVAMGGNSVAAGENSVALGANSVADEANTVSVGSAGNERRITNVAPGVNGTDAVNLNQMTQLRNDMGASLTSLQRSAFGGVAAAMAMPNVMPSGPGKTVVAAGVANYKGYGAFGAGATYRSENGKWLVNGAVSITPAGDTGVRAQAGYEF